jgi:hypothetical protein
MALTAERSTPERSGQLLDLSAAAGKKLFAGALGARDADGNATPGAVATTLRGVGRVKETVDNTTGSAGDKRVAIERGIFRYANSASADEIDCGDIGNDCYIVDDQTVAKTAALVESAATRSVAGKVFDVDALGVWVDFR